MVGTAAAVADNFVDVDVVDFAVVAIDDCRGN